MVSSLFVEKQLEFVQQQVVEQDFPEKLMSSGQILDISTEVPSGAETYSYRRLTMVGEAAILANGADDIPLVNAFAEKRIGFIQTIVDGYEYTTDDMERAEFAGMSIDAQMAIAAREIIETKFDLLGYDGNANFNLLGMLNHANVPTYTPAADGNQNGGTNSTEWRHKTAEQIYRDMRLFVTATRDATNMVETPEAIVIPVEQFDLVSQLPYPTNSNGSETILSFFLKTQRMSGSAGVQNVFAAPYISGKGAGGADLAISYRKRPDKIKLHMPLDFEMLPVQVRNFCYRVPCRMKTGGVQLNKPLSMRYMVGI